MNDSRKRLLNTFDKILGLKGLEIGALNSPIIQLEDVVDGGEIFYLDHLSTDELRGKYRADTSVNIDNIVNVDFVCPDGDLVKAVAGNQFDYIIASHVIEHVPNLLKFLQDTAKILKPGGQLFLIIPDKRFTFDAERPETTFGTVLDSFLSGDTKPGVKAVYDHFAKSVEMNAHEVWHGLLKDKQPKKLLSTQLAWELANDVKFNNGYYDVHVNIFTPQSFFEILERAILHNVVNFEVERFEDTEVGKLEFFTILKKSVEVSGDDIVEKCLQTIPGIRLENILSPYMPHVKALSNAMESSSRVIENLQKEANELRTEIKRNEAVIQQQQISLDFLQSIIDRRSVKLTLSFVDNLYAVLRGKTKRKVNK